MSPIYLKETKEIFRGVFFQILCYQTEIERINENKVDSTGSVFFIGIGHFTFNVKTLFPYESFFQLSGIPFAIILCSIILQQYIQLCYHDYCFYQ